MPLELAQPGQRVTIAASSPTSARAAAEVADRGGNAVDAALAATLTSLCLDVGLVAPLGSGFLHIWPRDGEPILIDAYAEVPGRGLTPERRAVRPESVYMEYGGGVTTLIGYASVATPGAFLGMAQASARFGALPWKDVLEPVIRIVDEGFPLAPASLRYLFYSGEPIFGWHPDSRTALFKDGRLRRGEERVRIPALVESLTRIADEGVGCLHGGELGKRITDDVQRHEGLLTLEDLAAYEAVAREPVRIRAGDWEVAVNPAPAFGGVTLAAMLLLLDGFDAWSESGTRRMIEAQRAVLDYRGARLERGDDLELVGQAARELIDSARNGELPGPGSSPSTIHTSAVDRDGLACSITMSAGYGSGAMADGTGLWLNNSLGEIELIGADAGPLPPGTRLQSNMAPTIARRSDGAMLAVGSPGAGRIATAITQVLANYVHVGLPLWESITHPRLHVEDFEGRSAVAFEAGLPQPELAEVHVRSFEGTDMYFGGIQAVQLDGDELCGGADPRRDGAVASGG